MDKLERPERAGAVALDRLLDMKEAATVIGVSQRQLYQYWVDGVIPSVYVGRLRRCRASDLQRFIESLRPA